VVAEEGLFYPFEVVLQTGGAAKGSHLLAPGVELKHRQHGAKVTGVQWHLGRHPGHHVNAQFGAGIQRLFEHVDEPPSGRELHVPVHLPARDEDALLGCRHGGSHICKIVLPVDEGLDVVTQARGGKALGAGDFLQVRCGLSCDGRGPGFAVLVDVHIDLVVVVVLAEGAGTHVSTLGGRLDGGAGRLVQRSGGQTSM